MHDKIDYRCDDTDGIEISKSALANCQSIVVQQKVPYSVMQAASVASNFFIVVTFVV
jgi:hypothetical protein